MASDLISRSKAVELVKFYEGQCDGIFHATEELGRMPTVDAVEVVRCKDCKYYEESYPGYGYCYNWDYEDGMSPNEVSSDDFCSRGVKMDGGDKA